MPCSRSFPSSACAVLAALLCWAGAAPAQEGAHAPRAELNVGIHLIHAELAADDASRMTGLMFRRTLPPSDGMLFRFDQEDRHCMWMRNTYLPLSVAFLDARGAVINVEEMQAQTDDTHCAARPARYALEMNARWFAQHGVRAGTVIEGVVAPRR
jgi:uncharacterized membrane protein (UPF0127 family)